jgi:serine/threonine-protein kinase
MKKCPKCGTEYPDTNTLCPSDGVALERTDDSLIGQTLAGKYRIDEKISEGGMGAVYRGTHVLMDKVMAIKVLRPSLAADEKIVARFSREARAASRISHPHALSVTDFGEDENGTVFLVMEYLDGKTLKDIIREEGPMQLSRVAEIIRQVGGALDTAHDGGVVHRDLKSENIMLISSTGTDYAKVLDFGIAKIRELEGGYDPELTAPNLVIGTPQYMSPEQCSQSSAIDSRSDIYSLGIIVFEMLVGHVPFGGSSPTEIMLKQMQVSAPSVLDERPDLPPSVGRIVSRALAKHPDERYQRVGELVEDLSFAAASSSSPAETRPIISNTEATSATPSLHDDSDEETVVRPRMVEPIRERAPVTVRIPPPEPAATTLNPWKILIPSAVALLVVFGIIYAFTRNSQPTPAAPQGPSLVADPNSQPVQPVQPATGKTEQGIPTGGATNPSASPSQSPASSPSPEVSETADENANTNANTNSNRKNPTLPNPSTRPVNVNEPPPPPPTPAATKEPAPKPTPTLPTPATESTPPTTNH